MLRWGPIIGLEQVFLAQEILDLKETCESEGQFEMKHNRRPDRANDGRTPQPWLLAIAQTLR